MTLFIRNEQPEEAEPVQQLITDAFLQAPHTDYTEQYIVAALRRAKALQVSQVAMSEGKHVGYIAVSPVTISDGTSHWSGLGPVAVHPAFQRKGVGSGLIVSALEALTEQGAAGCVVLGDPDFYGRFGFRAVDGLVYPGAPAEYFQALSFTGEFPHGEVTYHPAFQATQ